MVEIVHSVDEAEISTLVLFATSFRHGYETIESILPPTPDRDSERKRFVQMAIIVVPFCRKCFFLVSGSQNWFSWALV